MPPLAAAGPDGAAGARGAIAVRGGGAVRRAGPAVRADFAVTNENAPAVAEICVRLDGLPLAIELAAARIRSLTPATLLERLGRPPRVAHAGPLDAPVRQQTLRAAIDWSYELLERARAAPLRPARRSSSAAATSKAPKPSPTRSVRAIDVLEALVGEQPRPAIRGRRGRRAVLHARDDSRIRGRAAGGVAGRRGGAPAARGVRPVAGRAGRRRHDRPRLLLAGRARASDPGGVAERSCGARVGARPGRALRASTSRSPPAGPGACSGSTAEGRAWLSRTLEAAGHPESVDASPGSRLGSAALAWQEGDFGAARQFEEQALALFVRHGDEHGAVDGSLAPGGTPPIRQARSNGLETSSMQARDRADRLGRRLSSCRGAHRRVAGGDAGG